LVILLTILAIAAACLLATNWLRESFVVAPATALALLAVASLVLLPIGSITALILAATAVWFSLRRTWPSHVEAGPRTLRPSSIISPRATTNP
jgi:hypothetical protein